MHNITLPTKEKTNGYQLYFTTIQKTKYIAVPTVANKGTSQIFGDTLHTALEDALNAVEHNLERERYLLELEHERKQKQIEEQNRIERNKGKSKTQIMQEGRIEKHLSKLIRVNGVVMTRKEWLDQSFNSNHIAKIEDYRYYSKRTDKWIEKKECRLFNPDGSFITLTKIEYNYFNSL